jgi:ABC-2 type transport system ATP-binding protein
VSDHLILLAASQVQLCGDTDDLLAAHKVLVGPKKDTAALEKAHTIVQRTIAGRQSTMLVHLTGPLADPDYQVEDVSLEDLVLGYMGAATPAYSDLKALGEDS